MFEVKTPNSYKIFPFVLGLFLCTGRVPEALGLYLFGLILPGLFFLNPLRLKTKGVNLLLLGFLLAALYFIFPFHNFIGWAQNGFPFDPKLLYKSHFSSTLGICGIVLILLSIRAMYQERRGIEREYNVPFEKPFIKGLFWSSLALIVFVAIQFFTGYHFSEVAAYRADRVLVGDFYRASGYFNHPLTLAGFSLVILSYAVVRFFQKMESEPILSRYLFVIAGCHLLAVILSGSRAASLVAFMILAYAVLWLTRFSVKQKVVALSVGGILGALLVVMSGVGERFVELATSSKGFLGDRLVFWKVYFKMFSDAPLVGHGSYWIEQVLRDGYYNKLGFGDFYRKYNAHNLYLESLASCGVLGACLLGTCAYKLKNQLVMVVKSSRQGGLWLAFKVAFVSQLLFGIVQNTLFVTPTLIALLTLFFVLIWQSAVEDVTER